MTSRAADTVAMGGNVHRRLRRGSSIFLVLAAATALGCGPAGRDTATTDSSAAVPSASSATPAELKLGGDFQGPLGVQLYSFREAFKTDVRGTLARVRALGFREVARCIVYRPLAGFQFVCIAAQKAVQGGVPTNFDRAVRLRPDPHVLAFVEDGLAWDAEPGCGLKVFFVRLEFRRQRLRARSYFLFFLKHYF